MGDTTIVCARPSRKGGNNRAHVCFSLGFFGHRRKRFWNDRKKLSHFDQNVWKFRLKTLLRWVLIQLWYRWPKCFSDQNISTKNDRNVSAKKKSRFQLLTQHTCIAENSRVALAVSCCEGLHHSVDFLSLARQPETPQELSALKVYALEISRRSINKFTVSTTCGLRKWQSGRDLILQLSNRK